MRLTPPNELQHGHKNIQPGDFVDVSESDAPALLAEGWKLEQPELAEEVAEEDDEPTDHDEEI